MPATLPWPKIANTPAKSGSSPLRRRARAARRDSAPAPAPSSVARCRSRSTRAAARGLMRVSRALRVSAARCCHSVDQLLEIRADARASSAASSIVAGEPRARRLLEDRAADGEAAARRARAARRGTLRPACRRGALSPSSTTPRQCGSRSAISASTACHCAARHRLELPPFGIDAEVVEALQRAQHGVRRRAAACLRRNDLEQQLVAARLHGVVERAHLRFLLEPIVDRVVRDGSGRGT